MRETTKVSEDERRKLERTKSNIHSLKNLLKKLQKIFEKGLTNERKCAIINKLSRRATTTSGKKKRALPDINGTLKIEQCNQKRTLEDSERF
jgi:hypothetical protein